MVQLGEIQIGEKRFQTSEIFSAQNPTAGEMANFSSTFGLMMESGLPLLKAMELTAGSTSHPWLLAILASAKSKTEEGETLTGGMAFGLNQMISHRLAELSAKQEPGDYRNISSCQWSIPDFFGFFNDLLSLLDVGQESGSLQIALGKHVGPVYQNQDGYGKATWGHEFSIMCRSLELLAEGGVPNYDIARVLNELPSLIPLRPELEIFRQYIDKGETLADAFRKSGGMISDPHFCGLIEAGEETGVDLILARVQIN